MEERIILVLTALCLFLLIRGSWCKSFDDNEEPGLLTCACSGKVLTENLKANQAEFLANNKSISLSALGQRFRSCDSCKVSSTKCEGDISIFNQYRCIKSITVYKRLEMDYETMIDDIQGIDVLHAVEKVEEAYPKHEKIPISSKSKLSRHVRQLESCAYPIAMRTAELQCTIYPSSVKCLQTCAFGHTLPKGIEVFRVCNKRQDHWEPGNFQECKPFIDPGITLVSGGSFTCTTPTVQNGPECKIRCLPYEDRSGTAPSLHRLNIDGEWNPQLPFCAQPGSGRILVPRPAQGK